jgi:3-keto-5-aminohexanoate cleavage enzyme
MKELNKMVITATTANSWIYPDLKNWALNPDQLVESAIKCAEAGAAILHIHLPEGKEAEVVKRVREKTDAIIQCGMSSFPIDERGLHFSSKSDMLSIIANHHAEEFPGISMHRLHGTDELKEYCIRCKKFNLKPEWEIWGPGSYWNIKWLVEQKVLDPPYIFTLFFNWPGGTWSPATPEELLMRVKQIPAEIGQAYWTVSTMGKEQILLATMAIGMGGNIRIGTEDWPFIQEGKPAKDNAELIAKWVRIAKDMGREIATPAEARKMLGIKSQK